MQYKKSAFNYIQDKGEYYLIYNTLYNSLIRLDQKEYREFMSLKPCRKKSERNFLENGLWVDSDIDEKARYLACSEAYTLHAPRPLNITITTTLKCNARCSYCYEKGVRKTDIIAGIENKLIDFIRRHSDRDEVHLVWFGGEPLLNIQFMDSLSHLLKKENIAYSSYMISNGSLLNEDIIKEKFPLWNMQDLQITLDGTKENYEKIKNYKRSAKGEFYTILNAIKMAAEEGIFVNIRLNIGRENQDDIIQLLKELDSTFATYENVVFYPAFLTGETEPLSEKEKVALVKKMLLSIQDIKKLSVNTKLYSLPRMHACMNGDPKSYSIDVNGNVYSCEHYVGRKKHRMGFIDEDYIDKDTRGIGTDFRKKCKRCVFLPKCYGGCEANYMENDSPCMIEKYLIKAYLQIL